ncbi:MAG: wax ester/triacylglycerol synthase family O-acyltransferase [Jatrophihabitans sp.]|nr:MAG: wax ester/triacylglycerol synthase family O-acyltransferase [Jatrophihabitans sp.]
MLLPMPATSSMFLLAEAREHPMHVGGMQLFRPPEGMTALDVRALFDAAMSDAASRRDGVAPLLRKRPRRSVTTLGQWGWEIDEDFDLEHHVRRSALPAPGRVRDLLALVSRLHSTLLDRHRPLWEMHLIEGLEDGRFATYTKIHHALVDGVSSLRLLARMLSDDPGRRDMPPPWAMPLRRRAGGQGAANVGEAMREVLALVAATPAALPAVARMVNRARHEQAAALSFVAPRTMFNVPITGARRFAAQSWPTARLRRVSRAAGTTLNDVVLAMSAGALRRYLLAMDALPDAPLIAMVPVSLHGTGSASADGGGNLVGTIMCSLGTQLADPGARLAAISASMTDGKQAMQGLTQVQALAASALGISPLALSYLPLVHDVLRPPFNIVISNVPGPHRPMYWNGARLDGLFPLSIPLDGQALNITCTTYYDAIGFGIVGCRRSVPRLQRLLTDLDEELAALELAVAG